MSLRSDLHMAFDEVAPSTVGMPQRVVETVAVERTRQQLQWQLLVRFRAPLSLVAVLLLIALVVGALAGTRLLTDWSNYAKRTVPAGQINLAQLHQLELRSLHLPAIKSIADCQSGPWDQSDAHIAWGWLGLGPVYEVDPSTAPYTSTGWGTYLHILFQTDASLRGPVIVRARDLVTKRVVVFVGDHSTGPVVGTDTVNGSTVQQHPEAALDASHPPSRPAGGTVQWSVTVGLAGYQVHHSPSPPICVGWQVDGLDFSETFVSL